MIRFIDLRDQETGYQFAFFDTTTNKFVEFDGRQVWDTVYDFIKSFEEHFPHFPKTNNELFDRFIVIIPQWAFKIVEEECKYF